MVDLSGHSLGKYAILEEIGRGGMSVVYNAHDPALDRAVAVKVLAPHLIWDKEFLVRFQREARAAAGLKHPHITTIHDVGAVSEYHFIVMEYLDGPSLERIIADNPGGLEASWTVRIAGQMASALQYAHGKGIVHRDVKPGNIIVEPGDRAVLTDFGLVQSAQGTRLTQSGMVLGTPAYMAPEQIRGDDVGPATDVYALGIVTYEMLAGRTPFVSDTPMPLLMAHLHEAPPLLRELSARVPTELEAVVLRTLEKNPARRYGSAADFGEALTLALAQLDATAAHREGDGAPHAGRQSTEGARAEDMPFGESTPMVFYPDVRRATARARDRLAPVAGLSSGLQLVGAVALATVLVLAALTVVLRPRDEMIAQQEFNKTVTAIQIAVATADTVDMATIEAFYATVTRVADLYAQTEVAATAESETQTAASASTATWAAKPTLLSGPLPQTPDAQRPVPLIVALLRPLGGAQNGCVVFEWIVDAAESIPSGQIFEVRVCQDGVAQPKRQVCEPAVTAKTVEESSVAWDPGKRAEIENLDGTVNGQAGTYRWKVVLSGTSMESTTGHFDWAPGPPCESAENREPASEGGGERVGPTNAVGPRPWP